MTLSIVLVFIILLAALVVFIGGWIRMDVVGILVLGSLTLTGILTPTEALSGFSNPAVITIWSMFILSAALYQTGVARMISRQLLHFTGSSELKMVLVIMLTAGFISGFINNIGVATLMLPVVMDLARSTGKAPSRLLIPLVFGCHLGGFTTMIGTPPNLIISYALEADGHRALQLFDFTPVGLGVMLGGIAFMTFAGRHLLPYKDTLKATAGKSDDIPISYALQERAFAIEIRPNSHLINKTLAQSRLRAALGINVLAIVRNGITLLDPGPDTRLLANDKLHVLGVIDDILALKEWNIILPENKEHPHIKEILKKDLLIFEASVPEGSVLIDKNLLEYNFTSRLNINILSVKRAGKVRRSRLREYRFKSNDTILLQGERIQLAILEKEGNISEPRKIDPQKLIEEYHLHDVLFEMEVSQAATTFNKEQAESKTGNALGLNIVALMTEGTPRVPEPYRIFKPGDRLLVKCNINDLPLVKGIKELNLIDEETLEAESLESEKIQLSEVVLAPRSRLEGKTLREVNFRKKYGLTVLSIWREGRAHRTNLHNIPLRFGEALLIYGKRDRIDILGKDPDLLLLTESKQPIIRPEKALTSLLIMVGVLLPVLMGLMPLAISSVLGVAAMVLTRCIKMEDGYNAVDWRSVFLIAGMLPLGIAMQQTGAAGMLAHWSLGAFGPLGPWGIVAGLYIVTAFTALAIPPPALVVIMSPIVLQAAESFDISPHSLMIAIAIAASGTFMSPVSHAANLLVMGPGGYKFSDYMRVGLPLTFVVMLIVMILLPIFWPL